MASTPSERRVGDSGELISPVGWFVICSSSFLLVLVVATFFLADMIARQSALEEASEEAAAISSLLAAPLLDQEVRDGDPEAMVRLDKALRQRMIDGSVRHMKLWDGSGRVIWSDEQALVGRTFALEESVSALFGTEDVVAELSDLSRTENNLEDQQQEELLEVYVGAADADGAPFVFEAYMDIDQMRRDEARITRWFVPILFGGLLLFQLVTTPLAVVMSRRIRRAQAHSSRMTRHALRAAELEQRRIAEQLHDGVIQDVAGLAYAMPTLVRQLRHAGAPSDVCARLDSASHMVQKDAAMLRSLMTDIYPPDLVGEGLYEAVRGHTSRVSQQSGLRTSLIVLPELDVTPDTGRLIYRVIREALHNVVKHARAEVVEIEVGRTAHEVLVRITDDGMGPGAGERGSGKDHLGLTLLRDTIEDVGGELEVGERPPPGGTTVVARFPVDVTSG
ncbi:ATP-binding protein [Nocardioides sp.]|uniref:sensor histidine kinase n=1 Tax=Nocardioides sp. TaxID=35761 RepID=UPI00286AEA5E|nr:ATP-binding protein [Nocardioides sp.]